MLPGRKRPPASPSASGAAWHTAGGDVAPGPGGADGPGIVGGKVAVAAVAGVAGVAAVGPRCSADRDPHPSTRTTSHARAGGMSI
jgi:hypothetical protein